MFREIKDFFVFLASLTVFEEEKKLIDVISA